MSASPDGAAPPVPDEPEEPPEPPRLRRLRRLVTALAAAMILGVIAVAATLVIRVAGLAPGPGPVAAESIALPAGAEITAVGRSGGELLLVTRGADGTERVRAFDAETGEPRSVTEIARE